MRDIVRFLLRAQPRRIDLKAARASWSTHRTRNQWGAVAPLLSPPSSNAKFAKTQAIVFGLSLAPDKSSDAANVCRFSTPECRRGCVSFAGHGELPRVIAARALKVSFLLADPNAFVTLLSHEIGQAKRLYGDTLRVRLNTFSDIPWEDVCPWLFEEHSDVAFYDYTKWPTREPPANYDLTYSASEKTTDAVIGGWVEHGRVAVVFKSGKVLPTQYLGIRVIDGDKSDDRTSDPHGVVVGLRAKGRMRKGVWHMSREVA